MPAREISPFTPWPGFDPSFSGHNDRRAIISEWTRLRLRPLSHRGWHQVSRTSLIIDIIGPSKMADVGHIVNKICMFL